MTPNITADQVFALVHNALWNKEINLNLFPEDKTNWAAILKFAKQQTLYGIVADAIIRNAEQLKPGRDVLRSCAFKLAAVKQTNALLNQRVAEVVKIMTDNSIPSVLFKGQGIARLYPTPELRQCGDIDLYVGRENAYKARDIMVSLGLKAEIENDGAKHIHIMYKDVELELHRRAATLPSPIANNRWQKWTIEQLTGDNLLSYDFNGVNVTVPPIEFNVIFIFYHLYHHFTTEGIGLRQLCDWAMTLHAYHDKIDRDRLEVNLKRFGLLDAWRYFICILVDKLGLPADEAPLYDAENRTKEDMILSTIIAGGNFGHYHDDDERPKGYFAGKIFTFRHRIKYIFSVRLISVKDSLVTFLGYTYEGIDAIIHDKLHLRRK